MPGPQWTYQEMEDAMEASLRSGDVRAVTDVFSFLLWEGQTYLPSDRAKWAIESAMKLIKDPKVLSAADLRPLSLELLGLWPSLVPALQRRLIDEVLAEAEYSNASELYWFIEGSVGRGVSGHEAARHLESMLASPVESIRESALCALKGRLEDFNRANAADLRLGVLLDRVLRDPSPRVRSAAAQILDWCKIHDVPLGE